MLIRMARIEGNKFLPSLATPYSPPLQPVLISQARTPRSRIFLARSRTICTQGSRSFRLLIGAWEVLRVLSCSQPGEWAEKELASEFLFRVKGALTRPVALCADEWTTQPTFHLPRDPLAIVQPGHLQGDIGFNPP